MTSFNLHFLQDFLLSLQVVTKRRMLEATLACMEKLDIAEEIILNVHQQENSVIPVMEDTLAGDAVKGTGLQRRALLK